MSEDGWATISSSTSTYQSKYEKSCCSKESVWNNHDFKGWQTESYDIAKTLYTGKAALPDFWRHQREWSCALSLPRQKCAHHTVEGRPWRLSSLRVNQIHLRPISISARFCRRAWASLWSCWKLCRRSCWRGGNRLRRVTFPQLKIQILTLLKA